MAKRKALVGTTVITIATVAVCAVGTDVWAGTVGSQVAAESDETSAKAAGLTFAELETEIRTYYQYHAEEELLTCLREAKADPEIRGTHMVGPRLKHLEVEQRRYEDFSDSTSDLSPEDKQQVETRIAELHGQQLEHIEHTRGLFENGLATTNKALLEYHDTGCIGGLEEVVQKIGKESEATTHPESP